LGWYCEWTAVTRSRAEEYQRLAENCRLMAREVSTEEARASALAMAEIWQRLADEQNQGSNLDEMPARPPAAEQTRPVVQQQQQVQPKEDDTKE